MSRADYITEEEQKEYCENCGEICSRHCVIWRKAEEREDKACSTVDSNS